MKVTLLRSTESPEEIIALSAKICHAHEKGSDLKLNPDEIRRLLNVTTKFHHDSILEHVNFTFLIEDISRSLSHQLVRHRLCTFHQASQRYVKVEDLANDIVIPESISKNSEALETFINTVKVIQETYEGLVRAGIPKEDARYILPNATKTQLIFSTNARNLIHILGHRLCNRAMPEFRELADEILKICRKVMPDIFNLVGPNCFMQDGKCPEGQIGCRKSEEMKKKYTV